MRRTVQHSLIPTLILLSATARTGKAEWDVQSREVTVFNELTNPVTLKDAVSREVTVFKGPLAPPLVILDVSSREVTAFNDLTNPVTIKDVVSRELSAMNTFRCTGNLTDDGDLTMADLIPFIDTMVNFSPAVQLQQAADMNCDGSADGEDIQLFVNALLSP